MIGKVLAVQLTTASNSCKRSGRSAKRMTSAPKRAASLLPAVSRAVGNRHALGALGREMRRGEFDHLPCADEQHANLAEVFEQLSRQPHRRCHLLIECAPISVVLRTSLATEKLR